MDFRAGLDGALHFDGGVRMAGLATRRLEQTTPTAGYLHCATGAECVVDAAVLWLATARRRLRGDLASLACYCRNDSGISPGDPLRSVAARALSCVGQFRGGVEFHIVAAESLKAGCEAVVPNGTLFETRSSRA